MTHLPQLNVEAYLMAVAANPLLTKAMTSGIAYGLGDFLTQVRTQPMFTLSSLYCHQEPQGTGTKFHRFLLKPRRFVE